MRQDEKTSAPAGLFAAKGEAQPVDQTRNAKDVPTAPEIISPLAGASETAPLPDLFGEPANDETEAISSSSNATAEDTGTHEPPPAASLLTIVSQRSAARRRPGVSHDTNPDAVSKVADDNAIEAPPETVPAEKTAPKTANLPVPVQIQLPMTIESPVAGRSPWNRRIAALAACVAIAVAGAVTILIADTANHTTATTANELPSIAAGDAETTTTPEITRSAATALDQIASEKREPTFPAVVPVPPKTKIGSVRIDANSRAIVSGHAPPDAELIVLHNRQPLGTARSDAAGIWTFSARVPTRATRNEISVVPMQIDNSVMVTDIPAAPRPSRRPAIPTYYFAQIASLPSAADAGREAAKLGTKLADIVSAHRISVRVATIENGRKVYRVAIGGFSTKAGATSICGRIRARNSRCLVMRGY